MLGWLGYDGVFMSLLSNLGTKDTWEARAFEPTLGQQGRATLGEKSGCLD